MLAIVSGLSIGELAIWIVIVAAVVALVIVALKGMGVSPPAWAMQVLWIVVIAVVVIFAIRLVMSM